MAATYFTDRDWKNIEAFNAACRKETARLAALIAAKNATVECWDCDQAGRTTPAVETDPDDLCADCRARRDAEDEAAADAVERYFRAMGWLRGDGRD